MMILMVNMAVAIENIVIMIVVERRAMRMAMVRTTARTTMTITTITMMLATAMQITASCRARVDQAQSKCRPSADHV